MKTFKKNIYRISILLIIVFSSLHSRQSKLARRLADDPGGIIKKQVITAVQSQFGQDYRVAIQILDSAIARNETTYEGGELTDPYNILKGCVWFDADKQPIHDHQHGIVGIFKNGQIIWHSDPIFKGEAYGTFSIKDINHDGKIEILEEWTPGMQLIMVRHLWIISWDGITGTIINQIDSKTGNTTIHAQESMFELIAMDTISPLLIRAYWPVDENISKWFPNTNISTYPYVTYSWNGTQYGLWPTTQQIPGDVYLPANLLKTDVKSSAVKKNDSLIYNYNIYNSEKSSQSLSTFALSGIKSGFVSTIQNDWAFRGYSPIYSLTQWTTKNFERKGSVQAGKGLTLNINSKGLPSIVDYYAQGGHSLPVINPLNSNPNLASDFLSDMLTNSFHGFTIGSSDPPNPFVPLNFLDTLTRYTTQSCSLGWIKVQTTADKYLGYFTSAKASLQQNNIASTRSTLNQVLQDVNVDSTYNITSEAYALIRFNTEYLLAQLPTAPLSGCNVKLINSAGAKLTSGTLQYYDGSPNGVGWKDATNNNNGTFFVNTTKTSLSLRMTYEYGTQTKSNVAVGSDTVAFQTVNAQIQLQNSSGVLIDTGTVQYYAGAWRTFGTTISGIVSKELLPANYSFRMTYAYASKDKQQDLSTNPTVVFQTVNAVVQLQNSQGTLIDQGTVQYYSGAWRTFGTTNNGTTNKELLPNNYSFRMTYEYASKDKQQDLSTNPTVVFQTVNAQVQLKNSQGTLMPAPSGDQGTVQYYSGAWRTFGTTNNGTTNKELLPNNYSFRMTSEYVSVDKQQDLSANSTVSFSTVFCTIRVKNSQDQLVDNAFASYYSGAWRQIGNTVNGVITKELLPVNLSFRIKYDAQQLDKQQNLSTNNVVEFGIQ